MYSHIVTFLIERFTSSDQVRIVGVRNWGDLKQVLKDEQLEHVLVKFLNELEIDIQDFYQLLNLKKNLNEIFHSTIDIEGIKKMEMTGLNEADGRCLIKFADVYLKLVSNQWDFQLNNNENLVLTSHKYLGSLVETQSKPDNLFAVYNVK